MIARWIIEISQEPGEISRKKLFHVQKPWEDVSQNTNIFSLYFFTFSIKILGFLEL